MSKKKELTKDDRIKKEKNRLNRVFKELDKNKLLTVQSLIEKAAFMSVELEDLQETIKRDGVKMEYKNGQHQWGYKQSPEVEMYNSMIRNYTTIIKMLVDLAPPDSKQDDELDAFIKKFNKGKKK